MKNQYKEVRGSTPFTRTKPSVSEYQPGSIDARFCELLGLRIILIDREVREVRPLQGGSWYSPPICASSSCHGIDRPYNCDKTTSFRIKMKP